MTDTFEFPQHEMVIDRGAIHEPCTVRLRWMIVTDDGSNPKADLILKCELVLNDEDWCRELHVLDVSGDETAVRDFRAYADMWGLHETTLLPLEDEYDDQRMMEVAKCLGLALLLPDAEHEYEDLAIKVTPCAS